jgi:phosphoserine phosphatase RsbU/P
MLEDSEDLLVLTVEPAQGPAFEWRVQGEALTIGRSSKADLVVSDALLSREHARLFRAEGGWFAEDLRSRNGTRLNGQPLTEPRAVSPGDVLLLGGCQVVVGTAATEMRTPSSASGAIRGRSVLRPASDILKAARLSQEGIAEAELSRLRKFAERLQPLIEVNQALSRLVDLDELLQLILTRTFQQLKPEEGAVFLTRQNGEVYRAASRTIEPEGQALFTSRTLTEEVVRGGHALLVQDAQVDERFHDAESVMRAGVHSLIAAPFLDPDGTSLGMIVLTSRATSRQFEEDDLELLTSLAAVAALRIRNVALAEEAAQRRRLDDELSLARRIQVALYPKSLPDLPGYEIVAFNLPSRTVSGDLFQVMARKEGKECVLFIADVSGKGIGAALLTASLEALCAAPLEVGRTPDRVFARVSSLLYRRTSPEKYATALLATLRPESGTVRFANAGHNPGLLVRAWGSLKALRATGVPLGMFPHAPYSAETLNLNRGDTLILFTDGIVEARNPEGEEYGSARLETVAVAHRGSSAKEIAGAIERDLADFVGGVPYTDDRTLVILKRIVVPRDPGTG